MDSFGRSDIDYFCYLIAKEYKKVNRNNPEMELIFVGGASVLLNYNFRDETTDIDTLFHASSSLKSIIEKIGEENQLPDRWLNDDFKRTESFSTKLALHSKFYKRFCGCLNVRTVSGEYLIAMKIRAARLYKNDYSDIVGILKEHIEMGKPLSVDLISSAYQELYEQQMSQEMTAHIESVLASEDLDELFYKTREEERGNKSKLKDFEKAHPGVLKNENVAEVLTSLKQKEFAELKSGFEQEKQLTEILKTDPFSSEGEFAAKQINKLNSQINTLIENVIANGPHAKAQLIEKFPGQSERIEKVYSLIQRKRNRDESR